VIEPLREHNRPARAWSRLPECAQLESLIPKPCSHPSTSAAGTVRYFWAISSIN
jgi:hypothetical protein